MKGVARQKIPRKARLLIVPLYRIDEPTVLSCFKIANSEPGLGFIPCTVDHLFAIGRNYWADATSLISGNDIFITGDHIATGDLPHGKLGIIGKTAYASSIIDELSIGR